MELEAHVMDWFRLDWTEFGLIGLSTACVYVGIIAYTRIIGLRSFSKMSAADFAMTIAIGSLFASSIVNPRSTVFAGLAALAFLFLAQWFLALARTHAPIASMLLDNTPVLLMQGSTILDDNLTKVNLTRNDLYAKLREANVYRFDQVLAVVFETTGDVSVLRTEDPDSHIEPALLSGVQNLEDLE